MFLAPFPKRLEIGEGHYYFNDGKPEVKEALSDHFSDSESYSVTVSADGVLLEAKCETGLYYARLTLSQLMMNYRGCLPCLYIYDEPEYSYRGFMIDPCRHFFTVGELKKMIDAASLFKFNKFHFHLSDDQGFRAEIESYPLLTTVGSIRHGTHFGRKDVSSADYGGYYTKDELRDIVAFCAERHIEVIPEIEMPGHSSAILSAYPSLSCRGEAVAAKGSAGIFSDILCAGNPETLKMAKSVIDELCEIFPGEYFHIGGDEAPKTRWEQCPKCIAEKERLGLENFEQLQGHFVNTLSRYLAGKGKKTICWNEALRGGNIKSGSVIPAVWMEKTDASAKWANAGNPVIIESFDPYYVDYPYGMYPLGRVYNYDPRSVKNFNNVGKACIKGVESPIWTEYITSAEQMEYNCFPRWIAVAETGWNGADAKNLTGFVQSAAFFCDILRERGIHPAPREVWDFSPAKRLSSTLGFFSNTLTKDFVKRAIIKDE